LGSHQVGGLEVTVQDVARVYVLESPEELVEEVLHVLVRERLRRADHLVEVGVHEDGDNIEIRTVAVGAHEILDAYEVLMVKVEEELDLTERLLRTRLVLEDVRDLLDRARRAVSVACRNDDTKRARPNVILHLRVAGRAERIGGSDGGGREHTTHAGSTGALATPKAAAGRHTWYCSSMMKSVPRTLDVRVRGTAGSAAGAVAAEEHAKETPSSGHSSPPASAMTPFCTPTLPRSFSSVR